MQTQSLASIPAVSKRSGVAFRLETAAGAGFRALLYVARKKGLGF